MLHVSLTAPCTEDSSISTTAHLIIDAKTWTNSVLSSPDGGELDTDFLENVRYPWS